MKQKGADAIAQTLAMNTTLKVKRRGTYGHIYVCVWVYVCIYVYVCHLCVCMYMYMCVCMRVYVCQCWGCDTRFSLFLGWRGAGCPFPFAPRNLRGHFFFSFVTEIFRESFREGRSKEKEKKKISLKKKKKTRFTITRNNIRAIMYGGVWVFSWGNNKGGPTWVNTSTP